jgi:hypothetical protein
MATFEANTGLSWEEAIAQNSEDINNITSQMWVVNE